MDFKITKQFIIAGIVGILFVVALLIIAFTIECPTEFQNQIFKTIMALAAGAFSVMIPGAISFKHKGAISASGAIAVFVIVYFFSPQAPLDNSSCLQDLTFKGMVTIDGKPTYNVDVHISETGQLANTNKMGKFTLPIAQSQLENRFTLYCENEDYAVDTIVYVKREELENTVTIRLKSGKKSPKILYRGNIYLDGTPLQHAKLTLPQLRTQLDTDQFGFFEVIPENRIKDKDIRLLIRHKELKVNESIELPESELITYADINLTPFEDTTEAQPRVALLSPIALNRQMVNDDVETVVKSANLEKTSKEEYCVICVQFKTKDIVENQVEKCNSDQKYLQDFITAYEKKSKEEGLSVRCKWRGSGETLENLKEQNEIQTLKRR